MTIDIRGPSTALGYPRSTGGQDTGPHCHAGGHPGGGAIWCGGKDPGGGGGGYVMW